MAAIQENFETTVHEIQDDASTHKDSARTAIYRLAHRYQNRRKLIHHYHKLFPLSILIFEAGTDPCYALCYIFQNQQLLCRIKRDHSSEMLVGGCSKYWHWTLQQPMDYNLKLGTVNVIDYGILLPLMSDPSRPTWAPPPNFYTITTHEWNSKESVVY